MKTQMFWNYRNQSIFLNFGVTRKDAEPMNIEHGPTLESRLR